MNLISANNIPEEDLSISLDQINPYRGNRVVVVLDDDPTGTQTVHGVYILTSWSKDELRWAFSQGIFYILTNSRSLGEKEAFDLVFEICQNVKSVSQELDRPYLIVTRGDSTLRGHFEPETSAAKQAIGQQDALTVFAPAFFEGNRITLNNQHYISDGDELTPVSGTPFAEDKTFGFASSYLYEYVQEKSSYTSQDIFDLSLEDIRLLSVALLADRIFNERSKKVLIVNALVQADLNKVAAALYIAQQQGLNVLVRSGASMVSALGGIGPNLLESKDFKVSAAGGLIVVGSYVPKTTSQFNELRKNHTLTEIEIEVSRLIEKGQEVITESAEQMNTAVNSGKDSVLFTSRALVSGDSPDSSLAIVNQVSNGVISIMNQLQEPPAFVIAKGGITSSDVATKVLGIKRGKVLGQILPGVPVWELGAETQFPGIPFIVFPGNVGSETALSEAYEKLKRTTNE
ncbi:four-carbon acid sugar kinase family protein [Reichenbachiella ulvae]|uniref:Hydroxyacid dehydrogenase n=1 Tax=Reichenbachiella ulvae TaxID=2980104 RepID=A0ABT3CSM8_9BACT|nr:four-carbon acid sugar kinase family protein [Reichenbachiella ulvae]MCV9386705.1 hypothetical protein [Reichenbachiella ulvae]